MNSSSLRGPRLKEERKRLGLSQQAMAVAVGISREMWAKYEAGAEPGANALALACAAGVDIVYILTGQRSFTPPPALSADERYLLDRYRSSPQPLKDAALRVLLGGAAPKQAQQMNSVKISGNGSIGGSVSGGDLVIRGRKKAE